MLHSKSPIIRRKAKRKVQSCQTVKWPRGFEIVLKIGKMSFFQMNPYPKPISFANLFPYIVCAIYGSEITMIFFLNNNTCFNSSFLDLDHA